MANDEHIAMLRKGVDAWNEWRKANPDIRPHLPEADLSSADLSGAHLTSANLSSANLSGADLSGAHLTSAHLSGANLSGADLGSAYLHWANLSGADLSRANLTGARCARQRLALPQIPSEIRAHPRASRMTARSQLLPHRTSQPHASDPYACYGHTQH
jgi:Pentapeptide repeats (8 copies)